MGKHLERKRLLAALSKRLGLSPEEVIDIGLLMVLRRVATEDAKYGCEKRGKDRFRAYHSGDEALLVKMEEGKRETREYPARSYWP